MLLLLFARLNGMTFLKPRKQNNTLSSSSSLSTSSSIPIDITLSLQNNIINNNGIGGTKRSRCLISYTDSNHLLTTTSNNITDNTILVNILKPNINEINDYNIIPNTLTKANEALGGINPNRTYPLTKEKYHYYELRNEPVYWATSEGNSWQLPSTHPRNNKTICLRTSQEAGISSST